MPDITLMPDLTLIEFLGVPIYDNDFVKLLVRFAINGFFLTVLVRMVYYRNSGSKDYLFTYVMINIMVFFICFTLKKFELELGMALGLFAIFGVLRYRTDTIPIKEMTYLFMVIGLAVVNSLANRKVSYVELLFTNCAILSITLWLENLSFLKCEVHEQVLYERVDLVKPARYDELIADLESRTGLTISRVVLGKINFLQDTVLIDVYYYPHLQENATSEINVSRKR